MEVRRLHEEERLSPTAIARQLGIARAVGKLTDNPDLQAEGKAQKAKGAAQDVAGTIKGKLGDDI